MRGNHHSLPRLPEASKGRSENIDAFRIQAGARFVEDDHRRVVNDRLREPGTLQHALRIRCDPSIGGRQQADLAKHRFDSAFALGSWNAAEPGVKPDKLPR